MRLNVTSNVNNEIKFDVINCERNTRGEILKYLKKKYPNSEIAVLRVREAMSALGGII